MFTPGNFPLIVLLAGLVAGCSQSNSSADNQAAKIPLSSAAFSDGQTIPPKYTCSGTDVSPSLAWQLPPLGTKSIAVIVQDVDAPGGIFTHWVLFNLSPDAVELKEGVPPTKMLPVGAEQGVNDFGKIGYSGPCPPPGKPHRYYFKIYALDARLNLASNANGKDLLAAMNHHVIGEGELMGTFGR